MSEEELQERIKNVDIEYYNLKGEELHLLLPPGDLTIICNVLHDYSDLLMVLSGRNSEESMEVLGNAIYEVHAERCKKIQKKIENAIGYDTQAAIVRCEKKRKKKSNDDIGEDAMVLAVKSRRNQSKKVEEEPAVESKSMKNAKVDQLNLFDFIRE